VLNDKLWVDKLPLIFACATNAKAKVLKGKRGTLS
jgi:hypothetical protein